MLSWLRRPDDAENANIDVSPPRMVGAASIRILVVDDDANLRALLRTSFEMADVAVEEAENATEAAKRVAARHPDVIVLDVGMPGVDGITFCRGLKSDPRTRDIPVVLLTGSPCVAP